MTSDWVRIPTGFLFSTTMSRPISRSLNLRITSKSFTSDDISSTSEVITSETGVVKGRLFSMALAISLMVDP